MPWYYAKDNQRFGPYDDSQFAAMAGQGTIAPDTLVWKDGMQNWQAFHEVTPPTPGAPSLERAVSGDSPLVVCSSCNRTFPEDEVIQYQGSYICAACKPIFQQQLREGASFDSGWEYGGFWIRFVARVIDSMLMALIVFVPAFIIAMLSMGSNPDAFSTLYGLSQVWSWVIAIGYDTFFIGKWGATPGKMACGLRVIKADGTRVTYLRAFARYWATQLSTLILLIGYIIAAFDEEKRALHDHLCSTRVIRK